MTDKKTSMQIHESTLEVLHTLKKRQDSYEDVIRMLLQNYDESIEFQKWKNNKNIIYFQILKNIFKNTAFPLNQNQSNFDI